MTRPTSRPAAKGWCPGAYRPMMSGDGLVVRVRPMLARLEREQALGLCAAAQDFGSGVIDLTSRANLQIRGVAEAAHEPLLQRLNGLGLLPDDPALESRRNILVTPFWQANDNAVKIAREMIARLAELPDLPAKMGCAIDLASAPQFSDNSADFRIEHTADGGMILRADGASRGRIVTPDSCVTALIEMAHWFVDTGGPANRRMARHVALTALPAEWQAAPPAAPAKPLFPGDTAMGALYGAAFGQVDAADLQRLITATKATALRVTPWRLFLLENTELAETATFITAANDPLLLVDACPGAPLCGSSTVQTRELARALADRIDGPLHISGCAKGCARPRPCRTTLVGRDGAFDLVRNGTPWDDPILTDLAPETLATRIGDF